VHQLEGMTATIEQQGVQLARQVNQTQKSMATILLQLQQGMQQNQNFALHCFTTPGLTTAVTASGNSPCHPIPPPPGTLAVLLTAAPVLCMIRQPDTDLVTVYVFLHVSPSK